MAILPQADSYDILKVYGFIGAILGCSYPAPQWTQSEMKHKYVHVDCFVLTIRSSEQRDSPKEHFEARPFP